MYELYGTCAAAVTSFQLAGTVYKHDYSQHYASTGKGSIAEAIVVNAYWWTGQIAYEAPSGK
jgi:hypothetical protein